MSIPDATILVKGLSGIHADLNFRLQLTRNQLMVDTIPSQDSVTKYSHHLLAKLETMGHQARKKEAMPEAPKIKKFEEQGKETKTKEVREGEGKEKGRCRFYLTDAGKQCTFSHDQKDEMAPACSRPKEGKEGGNKSKLSKVEKTKDTKDEVKEDEDAGSQSQPSMKDLLEEANKVLKSLNSSPSSSHSSPTAAEGDERQEGRGAASKTAQLPQAEGFQAHEDEQRRADLGKNI